MIGFGVNFRLMAILGKITEFAGSYHFETISVAAWKPDVHHLR
jgi:hypothetical protein